jgi:hypothetical protein
VGKKAREKRDRRDLEYLTESPRDDRPIYERWWAQLWEPQPIVRLAAVRILVPLAILGFMSSRVIHADHWIGSSGFHVPNVGYGDWRQPLYIPPLPNGVAWTVAVLLVLSALATSAGALTRVSSAVFAVILVYVALADRLAAFTVSKLGAVLAVGLALTPCAARASVDAWLRPKDPAPTLVQAGNVRFFQLTLVFMYFGSGVAKYRGDWWDRTDVIYTHLHDTYQTWVSYMMAKHIPTWGWTGFQYLVLALEFGAPLWFALRYTRNVAVVLFLGMHLVIGLGFGPVVWFACLMASLLIACFAPQHWLERALRVESAA